MVVFSRPPEVPRYQSPVPSRDKPIQHNDSPRIANVGAVLGLGGADYFHFRGVTYRVQPLGFEDGCKLQDLTQQLGEFARQNVSPMECLALLRSIADVFRSIATPAKGIRRILWKFGLPFQNPFRAASQQELGELLGFFLGRRTMSSVRLPE